MSARDGWNLISKAYQNNIRVSLEDVHYGPISPGERELKLLGNEEGKDVLEIGCGGGHNAIVLAKWGARSAGLDARAQRSRSSMLRGWHGNKGSPFDFIWEAWRRWTCFQMRVSTSSSLLAP